jgi:lipopolysaccharide biosynthesis glycosyltransferase
MPLKPDIIVIAINQKFFEHLKALLGSIFINWPNSPDIVVYAHPDLTEESIIYLGNFKKVSVKHYNPKELKFYKLVKQGITYFKSKDFIETGYFSLHLFSEDFNNYKNLLFLDADTLVLKPLDELLQGNKFFICSANNARLLPYFNVSQAQPKKSLLIGYWLFKLLQFGILPKPFVSANSGVMVIPEKLRDGIHEREILAILKQFQSVCSSDQEIILLYAMKHKIEISKDYRFNFQIRFFNLISQSSSAKKELLKASNEIKVLHFNGPKPDAVSFETHPWTIGQNFWKQQYYHYKEALNQFISR